MSRLVAETPLNERATISTGRLPLSATGLGDQLGDQSCFQVILKVLPPELSALADMRTVPDVVLQVILCGPLSAVKNDTGSSEPPTAASEPVNLTEPKSASLASLQVLPQISGDSAIHSADASSRLPEPVLLIEKVQPSLLLMDNV